ncbi:hypothetical protein ACFC09_11285 [Streptomyces sp. NPDC056161]|uniref:hypothetical protein n=1 Tax=Streptomyces sp. NPDC056161 TaxID=3345732 RepID=UPI0035E288DF
MIFWLKTRRAHTVLPASFGAFIGLVAFVGDVTVFLPSLGGSHQVALSLFAPIPLVAGLAFCLESRIAAAEISAVRVVARMDIGLILITAVSSVAIGALVHQITRSSQADITGRNFVFMTGLMLCGRVFFGERAVLVPVMWTLSVVMAGFRPTGDAYPWTIIPETAGTLFAAFAAFLIFAIGILAHLYNSRKIS